MRQHEESMVAGGHGPPPPPQVDVDASLLLALS